MNLVGKTGGKPKNWDKARKKDLTIKSPEGDKDQDLISGTECDKCIRSRDHMRFSKSSISKSERFRRKLKFQENRRVEPRIEDIGVFLSVTTLSSLSSIFMNHTPMVGMPTLYEENILLFSVSKLNTK